MYFSAINLVDVKLLIVPADSNNSTDDFRALVAAAGVQRIAIARLFLSDRIPRDIINYSPTNGVTYRVR